MPKRKRSEADNGSASRLRQIIDKHLLSISNALKSAAFPERQKLGRRLKEASDKNEAGNLKRIHEEIYALKTFDYQKVAEAHLRKRLLKIKTIASSPVLETEAWFKSKEDAHLDQVSANLNGRLFKMQTVRKPVDEAVDAILKRIKKKDKETPEINTTADDGKVDEIEDPQVNEIDVEKMNLHDDEEDLEIDSANSPADGFDMDEEILLKMGKRVIGSESESESESALESDLDSEEKLSDIRLQPVVKKIKSRGLSVSLSPTPERQDSLNESLPIDLEDLTPSPSPEPETSSKVHSKAIKPAPASNMYIPLLTEAGYISGSDADSAASSINDRIAPRKNRRGQRERRAIAEKKYGHNAKHVKEGEIRPAAGRRGRDAGWDPKRGAVGDNGREKDLGQGRVGRLGGISDGRQLGGTDAKDVSKPKRDDQGPLHPSWVAQKAAKAKEKQAMAVYQGKIITFD